MGALTKKVPSFVYAAGFFILLLTAARAHIQAVKLPVTLPHPNVALDFWGSHSSAERSFPIPAESGGP